MASIDAEPEPNVSQVAPRALELARVILATVLKFLGTLVAIVFTLVAGIWTARTMIESGSTLSTETHGPWQTWPTLGTQDADPYARAHLAKSGAIAIAADSAGVFEARIDAEGARLHSSCDYIVEGLSANGLWWSLAVFDARGELIENDAKRYVFTSDTVATNPDGSFIVSLGRDARPGNWLPTGGAGRLVLVFTLLDPATGFSAEQRAKRFKLLPQIRREGCS